MATLPTREYSFYAGIDPGFSGAIGVINAAGTTVHVWDMPVVKGNKDREREINLEGLRCVFRRLKRRPDLVLGLEWPTTRPGEGAERCERFGRQKGTLLAYAYLQKLDYYCIAPNLWKGRLDLPGKGEPNANRLVVERFEKLYPDHRQIVRGPRGGIKDGRLDALMIAHFLRSHAQEHGRRIDGNLSLDNPDALGAMFGIQKKRGKKSKNSLTD